MGKETSPGLIGGLKMNKQWQEWRDYAIIREKVRQTHRVKTRPDLYVYTGAQGTRQDILATLAMGMDLRKDSVY